MATSLRFAQAEDTSTVADFILEAGAGLFEFLLNGLLPGVRAKQLLQIAVTDESSVLNYSNAILAEADGQAVGMVLCYPSDEFGIPPVVETVVPRRRLDQVREILGSRIEGTFYINTFAVSEGARGKGVGRMLLGCAADLASELSFELLTLHVWADNDAALGLYRGAGFETVKTIPVATSKRLAHRGGMLLMSAPLPLRFEAGGEPPP